jgi:excisionase family DNA binding protein
MATPHRPHRPAKHHHHHDRNYDRGSTASRPTTSPDTGDDGLLLYTPAEAAQRLRVRESWLRKKAAAREVPCTFLGKHLRFSAADLTAIVAASARPAVGRRPRRKAVANSSTVRDRDLPPGPNQRVHPPDRDDHSCDGSSTWPG